VLQIVGPNTQVVRPKTLQRIFHFQRFLGLASRSRTPFADLAIMAGYADQAHLARSAPALRTKSESADARAAILIGRFVQDAPPLRAASSSPATGGGIMKARISILTIGVDDLERSLRFYRDGLGLPTEGIIGTQFEHGAVAFFELQNGLKLAAWSRDSLSYDCGLPQSGRGSTQFSIGHNVSSEAEVDSVMEQAAKAGARIVKKAQKTFWGGYAGYFQDPDDHLWEVAFNPNFVPVD
jgi:catechol 2,3-dioxygenase-like lactoylglutathione lyase family enzyme